MKASPEEIERNLRAFSGSEQFYRTHPNVIITEGVHYLAEACGAYWLIDCVFSYQTIEKVANEPFQTIELTVENNKAKILVTDGNENELFTQVVPFTDFPLNSIKLYYSEGTLMLPSEY